MHKDYYIEALSVGKIIWKVHFMCLKVHFSARSTLLHDYPKHCNCGELFVCVPSQMEDVKPRVKSQSAIAKCQVSILVTYTAN